MFSLTIKQLSSNFVPTGQHRYLNWSLVLALHVEWSTMLLGGLCTNVNHRRQMYVTVWCSVTTLNERGICVTWTDRSTHSEPITADTRPNIVLYTPCSRKGLHVMGFILTYLGIKLWLLHIGATISLGSRIFEQHRHILHYKILTKAAKPTYIVNFYPCLFHKKVIYAISFTLKMFFDPT